MSAWMEELTKTEENKLIFSRESDLNFKPSSAGLESCFTCFRKTDSYVRITHDAGVSGENLEAIFSQHFWFTKDEYHNRTICQSCWEKIDDFHWFYCEVERAYAPPALAEIKVEFETNDHEVDSFSGMELEENEEGGMLAVKQDVDDSVMRDYGLVYAEHSQKVTEEENSAEADNKLATVEASDSDSDLKSPPGKRKTKRRNELIKKSKQQPQFICDFCNVQKAKTVSQFSTYPRLKRHSLMVHGKAPIINCCDQQYSSCEAFLAHFAAKHESPLSACYSKRCEECGVEFRERDSYDKHMQLVHIPEDQKHFKCSVCPKAFVMEELLNSHLRWHQEIEQKNYHCTICDRYFHKAGFLAKHQERHHRLVEKEADAERSDAELAEEDSYQHHGKRERLDEFAAEKEQLIFKYVTLACPRCEHVAETLAELRRHGRAEHGQRTTSVTCCQRKFSKQQHLYEHCLTHVNPDHFKCDICAKVFNDNHGLQQHKWKIHTPVSELPFKCDVCGAAFMKDYLLKQHTDWHVGKERKTHHCELCNKTYSTSLLLKEHQQKKHDAVSDWVCDICAKGFVRRVLLEEHRLTHSEEGQASLRKQCEKCQRWLINKRSYLRHKRTCSDTNGPVQCDICGKSSINKSALAAHKKSQHTERPTFRCSYCEKEFKTTLRLKEHEATHTGAVLYQCSHCPRTSNSSSNMYSHKKTAHPEKWAEEVAARYGTKTR